MDNISTHLSDELIRAAIEENLNDFYIKSSTHENFRAHIDDKISWVVAKKADWPSCIFRANYEGLSISDEVNQVKQLIVEGNAPNGWTIGPMTKPENLGDYLKKQGFQEDYHQVGMAVDLVTMKNRTNKLEELDIKKVNSKKTVIIWIDLVSKVFNIKVDTDLIEYLQTQKEVRLYYGIYNDTPVSSLMLYLSSGVAGLHAVTTLSEYRGQGFGYSISRYALLEALDSGYKVGVLQASSLGQHIYKKLGFKKLCDISSYALEGME